MRKIKTYSNHTCCPPEWRGTQDMTGSFELDAMIARTANKDMGDRLQNHLVDDTAYKINNAYGRGSID